MLILIRFNFYKILSVEQLTEITKIDTEYINICVKEFIKKNILIYCGENQKFFKINN